jgi:predicted transcriptional regulator
MEGGSIRRRGKQEIISNILDICKSDSASKTKIVYQANLNFKTAAEYIDLLIDRGFLAKKGKNFIITPSGLSLLASLNEIESLINEDIQNSNKSRE